MRVSQGRIVQVREKQPENVYHNSNMYIPINNYFKWTKCTNKNTQGVWMD